MSQANLLPAGINANEPIKRWYKVAE